MNERIANLASLVAAELIAKKIITEDQHEEVLKIIGETIYAEVYPAICADCHTVLCPRCGAHAEPPVDKDPNESEALWLCPYCVVYIQPDRSTTPVLFENDRRYAKVADLPGLLAAQGLIGGIIGQGDDEPPTEDGEEE